MPSIVNTNIASLNAQRNLNQTQRASDTALQRLSSGLRINSAKDDAAGLAISTRFDSQIRGTNVAIRNAGDGISLAQTAEGAMDSINTSLQRIRELSLQSANDTNSAIDRQALQEEVSQLVSEIENVAKTTSFNGKNLLDGSFSSAQFQTGANVGDTVKVSIGKLDQDSLGTALTAGLSSNVSKTGLTTGDDALVAGDLVINGVAIAASAAASDTASTAKQSSSAISKAAAINAVSAQTGVTATANANTVEGTTVANSAAAIGTAINVTVNGVAIALTKSGTGDAEVDLAGVADALNAKTGATGVSAAVVKTDGGARIDLTAEDGRNIQLTAASSDANTFGLAAAGTTATTFVGDYTLQSNDGSDIKLSTTTGDIDNAGFEVGTFSGSQGGVVGDNVATGALAAGDVTINGVSVGVSKASDDTSSTLLAESSGIAKAAAINRISEQTGVTAKANVNTVNSAAIGTTGGAMAFSINGTAITGSTVASDQGANQTSLIDAINAKSGQTGVTAEALEGDKLSLVAADGRNITITGTGGDSGFAAAITAGTQFGSVSLQSAGQFEIGTQTGANDKAGLSVGKFGGAESGTKLSDIDISTVEGANKAIKAVDNAVQTISSKRAELGAIQNRFTATISNLESRSENLSAANSRIKDADFAKETAELSRTQVLQQAGISILAQANARPQQALSLLG
ncbi:flagellin [Allohahella marinimesophila]|uniref:Flagellin n=1 Tax=Allohahella marinimesophila TaxID=1054972 RepID=A0ABP7NU29_9GAMM